MPGSCVMIRIPRIVIHADRMMIRFCGVAMESSRMILRKSFLIGIKDRTIERQARNTARTCRSTIPIERMMLRSRRRSCPRLMEPAQERRPPNPGSTAADAPARLGRPIETISTGATGPRRAALADSVKRCCSIVRACFRFLVKKPHLRRVARVLSA